MKQIILGTAGHIDHGKTSLIKAVTGVNTDRLKEEQLRGITIELGFAALDLPSGLRLGIVDVPGHEKFVKNMVAGASGIDLVAMIIAADEGIMPQTREHMEICSLLGIQHGVVVLTKIDLVDEEWLALVEEEVLDFTANTFLDGAPVVKVSAVKSLGLTEFVQVLDGLCTTVPARTSAGLLRLPVDRVFSMKGFGTVITGTLVSGKVTTGDRIMLYPSGITARVRGVQVHNQSVSTAEAGMRTAVNFQGLDKAQVNRGDILGLPETLVSSYMVDIRFHYLASNSKALKNRTTVRFHTGTSEIMGVVVLLDRSELQPGETAMAQIRLDQPVTLIKDDRYVVRSYSPVRTIGGGQVLNPMPAKHKQHRPEVVSFLNHIASAPVEEVVAAHIEGAGYRGALLGHLLILANINEKQIDKMLQAMLSRQQIVQVDKDKRLYVHEHALKDLKERMRSLLADYHRANLLKPGMSKEELKSKLPVEVDAKLFALVLQQMVKAEDVVQGEDMVHLADHKVALGADHQALRDRILRVYQNGGLTPPYFKAFCQEADTPVASAREVLSLLIDEGLMVKIKEDLYYHHEPLEQLKQALVDFFNTRDELTTLQFKEMTGTSRKFMIPLLEYFDTIQFTIRVGDTRKLRKKISGT